MQFLRHCIWNYLVEVAYEENWSDKKLRKIVNELYLEIISKFKVDLKP